VNNGKPQIYMSVNAYMRNKKTDSKQLAEDILSIIKNANLSTDTNIVFINVIYGFDIGVARRTKADNYVFETEFAP
jgi:hypothetical protein